MKVTSKNNSKLLGLGLHLVTIIAVVIDTAKASDLYKDVTQQLVITFENAKKQTFKRWYNLMGFQLDEKNPSRLDEQGRAVPNYAVDAKSGKRIEDKEKTASAMSILSRLAYDSGVVEGEEIDTNDLIDSELGIFISRDEFSGKNKIEYTTPASEVPSEEEAVPTEA